jgi:hypothetical protein
MRNPPDRSYAFELLLFRDNTVLSPRLDHPSHPALISSSVARHRSALACLPIPSSTRTNNSSASIRRLRSCPIHPSPPPSSFASSPIDTAFRAPSSRFASPPCSSPPPSTSPSPLPPRIFRGLSNFLHIDSTRPASVSARAQCGGWTSRCARASSRRVLNSAMESTRDDPSPLPPGFGLELDAASEKCPPPSCLEDSGWWSVPGTDPDAAEEAPAPAEEGPGVNWSLGIGGFVRRWSRAERSWTRCSGVVGRERRVSMSLRLRKGDERIWGGMAGDGPIETQLGAQAASS